MKKQVSEDQRTRIALKTPGILGEAALLCHDGRAKRRLPQRTTRVEGSAGEPHLTVKER